MHLSNLLFLHFPFPFQFRAHSWNQGALHADEQATFSSFFFLCTHRMEKVSREGAMNAGELNFKQATLAEWESN